MKILKISFGIVVTVCLFGNFACEKALIDEPAPNPPVPVDYTVKGQLLSLPENYSLIKEILQQSGLSETLADTTQTYTFFVQNNADFAAAKIYSINDLLAKLRVATPEAESDSVLLANFIQYRTISCVVETDSLLKMPLLETLVADRKIFLSLDYGKLPRVLKFNDLNGHLTAPDAVLDSESEYSGLHCSNGIIHKISGNLWIKNRQPYRIYWDIAEQPEIMTLPNFRQPDTSITLNNGDLGDVTWEGKDIIYGVGSMPETATGINPNSQYIYGDYLRFNLNMASGSLRWIEFRTPVLIPGEYKVWVCYRREMGNEVKTTFKQEGKEDQVLPYIFAMDVYMPPDETDEALELQGWKFYTAKKTGTGVFMFSRLVGIIKVESEGRHSLLFEPTRALRNIIPGNWDMIQFIPSSEDQYFPRVDMQGNWVGADVEECNIFPVEY